jgi:hypothetical protein
VAFGNGQYVVVGLRTMFTSVDAVTWTHINPAPNSDLYSVTFGNGEFVAVGQGGTIMTSSDGAIWTPQISGTNTLLYSVTYGNGRFVAVGLYGTILVSKADNVTVAFQNISHGTFHEGLKIKTENNCISAVVPVAEPFSLLRVKIFMVSGKQMYSAVTNTNNGILNIPAKGFPAGKYFISITDEKDRTSNAAFVLTRR